MTDDSLWSGYLPPPEDAISGALRVAQQQAASAALTTMRANILKGLPAYARGGAIKDALRIARR